MYAHALAADPPERYAVRIFTSTYWLQELVESDDHEDVITDTMPDSHEVTSLLTSILCYFVNPLWIDVLVQFWLQGLLQLARYRYGPDVAFPPPPSCPTPTLAAVPSSHHSHAHKAPPSSSSGTHMPCHAPCMKWLIDASREMFLSSQ